MTFDRPLFIFFKHIFFLFYNIIHNDDLYRKSLYDRARPPFLSLLSPNGLVVFSFHCPIKTEINKMKKSFVIIYPYYLCIIISIFCEIYIRSENQSVWYYGNIQSVAHNCHAVYTRRGLHHRYDII